MVYTALEIYSFAHIFMFRILPYNDQASKSVVLCRKMVGFVEERPWGPRGFSFFLFLAVLEEKLNINCTAFHNFSEERGPCFFDWSVGVYVVLRVQRYVMLFDSIVL